MATKQRDMIKIANVELRLAYERLNNIKVILAKILDETSVSRFESFDSKTCKVSRKLGKG